MIEIESSQDFEEIGISAELLVTNIESEVISWLRITSVESGSKVSQVGLISGVLLSALRIRKLVLMETWQSVAN